MAPPPYSVEDEEAELLMNVQSTTDTVKESKTMMAPPPNEEVVQSWINMPVKLTTLFDEMTTHDEPECLPFSSNLSNDTSALLVIEKIVEPGLALMTTSAGLLTVTSFNAVLIVMVDSW